MQGIPRATAARRISQPSERAPEPVGVLITRSTSPEAIASTTCGEPSPTLRSVRTGTPMRAIACAVPRVATISKPRSCSCAASPAPAALSVSVTVMKTVPPSGSAAPAAACAFANAVWKSVAIPITSPVERISGRAASRRRRSG